MHTISLIMRRVLLTVGISSSRVIGTLRMLRVIHIDLPVIQRAIEAVQRTSLR